jgi:anaerobic dimethyl sulfoxide reductase subunit A
MDKTALTRRCFLKWSALLGTSAMTMPALGELIDPAGPGGDIPPTAGAAQDTAVKIIRAGCPSHNCGGRCLLRISVQEGKIVRIETDDRPTDTIADPQLRACIRGRAYRKRQYHPDRLQDPLKRTGARGEGKFERVSWDEALEKMSAELKRVKAAYGNSALFVPYGTGSYSQTNGRQTAQRLLNLFGGSLGGYNNYSWACMANATSTVYGTNVTGNQRQDWVNAKLILMWGWNPAEMRDGTNTEFFLRKARENGAKIVLLDPRLTMSAVSLADEWIPVRPGTDAAMMSAMAHVMIKDGLIDADFVTTHCLGFDETQMPPAAVGAESYKDYILGTRDGKPKSPEWAEPIPGFPGKRSPGWPVNTRPGNPASSIRATECNGAPTANRSSGRGAFWPRSPETSAFPEAGPEGWACKRRTAGRPGTSSPRVQTRSGQAFRRSSGPKPFSTAKTWGRNTASAALTSSITTSS